jgi:scyllo-inositol 2-dehydrogenase (NADP+)
MEFDGLLFQVESSRVCRLERPRWSVLGTEGAYVKFGIDPQEDALRGGDIDRVSEPSEHQGRLRRDRELGSGLSGSIETVVPTVRAHWDAYYANIADALLGRAPLAVTAEQAREVVRVLEAAEHSARERVGVSGPWGS